MHPPAAERPVIVILGASARALAVSATRAGWGVQAADLFGDIDLVESTMASRRVTDYPAALVSAAATFASGPWCYTGALENHPDLIDGIAAVRPLAGNGGAVVRRVRDAAVLAEVIPAAGLHFPETHASPAGLPTDGSFLVKPRASAAGRGIVRWTAAAAARHRAQGAVAPPRVWQRFVEGELLTAAFVMQAGSAVLLGASRQLSGEPWCHARPFAYCGSIALPVAKLRSTTLDQLARLGTLLADSFGLIGVVGTDLVVNAAGAITLLEVNPRPTASMELFERATGSSIAAQHLAACGLRARSPAAAPPCDHLPAGWSKAVLCASRDLAIDAALLHALVQLAAAWTESDGWPALADIPQPGQTINSGSPFITVFARGTTAADSHRRLIERTQAVQQISLRRIAID